MSRARPYCTLRLPFGARGAEQYGPHFEQLFSGSSGARNWQVIRLTGFQLSGLEARELFPLLRVTVATISRAGKGVVATAAAAGSEWPADVGV